MKRAVITIVAEQEVEGGPVHFRKPEFDGLAEPFEGVQMCHMALGYFVNVVTRLAAVAADAQAAAALGEDLTKLQQNPARRRGIIVPGSGGSA